MWFFKRFLCPKWFWQNFCLKKSTHLDHSYLRCALDQHKKYWCSEEDYPENTKILSIPFLLTWAKFLDLHQQWDSAEIFSSQNGLWYRGPIHSKIPQWRMIYQPLWHCDFQIPKINSGRLWIYNAHLWFKAYLFFWGKRQEHLCTLLAFAKALISVVQTEAKWAGCENKNPQESPNHSWKSIFPSSELAVKLGTILPILACVWGMSGSSLMT